MASILDRYGIKEVADVTFYELNEAGVPTNPVLYLDTLKVSTIEQTAEQSEAKGGKGNSTLIMWDFGKEINVTLEDALFSAKSMAIMFGNGKVKDYTNPSSYIMKTETFVATDTTVPSAGTDASGWKAKFEGPDGTLYPKVNPKFFDENGTATTAALVVGKKYFCTYDLLVKGSVIEISATTFPGVYYVTGDTYARSEVSGKDEFFQFILQKAKVLSENTITLEAEGDPSVFNMNLRVLRPADGKMMKLVKYELDETGSTAATEADAEIVHNHNLGTANMLATTVATSATADVNITGVTAASQVVLNTTIATAAAGSGKVTFTGVAAGTTVATVRDATGENVLGVVTVTVTQAAG